MYDYLIIGAGLFGSVFAHEAKKAGKKVLVIDKREHIGGNVYTENVDGINVHRYGAHIFHTNDKDLWDYVNRFVPFTPFVNSPLAYTRGELFNLPFNMNTFYKLWGVRTPEEAKQKIKDDIGENFTKKPRNLEEQAINLVGREVYELFIKYYTSKQWGVEPKELPAFIIKRIPVRFTYDNNYFNDKFQGIPQGGYTQMVDKMLHGIEVRLGQDYLKDREFFDGLANKILYTGPIDAFYNYEFGALEYRSLRFEDEKINLESYQGNAVVNYTDDSEEYTRILEHKHFDNVKVEHTIITREYPEKWVKGKEPYYPVNNKENNERFKMYKSRSLDETNVLFGGRLAEYKYYDMHQVIAASLKLSKEVLE